MYKASQTIFLGLNAFNCGTWSMRFFVFGARAVVDDHDVTCYRKGA